MIQQNTMSDSAICFGDGKTSPITAELAGRVTEGHVQIPSWKRHEDLAGAVAPAARRSQQILMIYQFLPMAR